MSNPTVTYETESVGLGFVQSYPTGVPEELPLNASTSALANSIEMRSMLRQNIPIQAVPSA